MASLENDGHAPLAPQDTRSLQEIFTSLHNEIVLLGPRGMLVLLGVLFSSSGVFIVRGCSWLYRKAAGYA